MHIEMVLRSSRKRTSKIHVWTPWASPAFPKIPEGSRGGGRRLRRPGANMREAGSAVFSAREGARAEARSCDAVTRPIPCLTNLLLPVLKKYFKTFVITKIKNTFYTYTAGIISFSCTATRPSVCYDGIQTRFQSLSFD